MGTEIAISFSNLRAQLENEKSSLYKIDENIKRIQITRFPNDRFNNSSGDYARGAPRQLGRNSFPEAGNNYKNDDQFNKRKHETKTVFSRLSARVHDSDGEDDGPGNKRARVPSAVCRELPTRAAVLRAQGDDEQARTRNRRIFGSLLGTLQKFKQEEIVLQTKEDKKAQVERKIEEQARLEKEREQKERKTLYAEREHKKANIKALEAKMARVQEFEKWEASQKSLGNFILTKARPHVYWLPKKMTDKATEKLNSSRKFHEKCMIRKRQELQEELQRIEQRCLRMRGPGAKENDPESTHNDHKDSEALDHEMTEDEKGSKRNKFAMDADEKDKDDSDADDRQEDASNSDIKPKEEKDDATMDTSIEQQNTTKDQDSTMETDTQDESRPAETTTDQMEVKEQPDKEEQNSDHS
ncbi:pinin [Achroia grisella]|uniref:pinin n=1 Tax=Achroia grisella TaxID=688607 RepID=UPI0027D2CDBE|nr:pinin [Achroia grisella]